MTVNPHFETADTWTSARGMLAFDPREPAFTAGYPLIALRIHVRDHKHRELTVGDRTLEAHYGAFSVSAVHKGDAEARRLALDVSYGRDPRDTQVGGHPARIYELGAVPPPDDIDGRMPSVIVWHDGPMLYLVASGELPAADLVPIAQSMYSRPGRRPHRSA